MSSNINFCKNPNSSFNITENFRDRFKLFRKFQMDWFMVGNQKSIKNSDIEKFLKNIHSAMEIYQNIYDSELDKQKAIINKEWDSVLNLNNLSNSYFKQISTLHNSFLKQQTSKFKELDKALNPDSNKKLYQKYQNMKNEFENIIENLQTVNLQNTRLLHDSFEINKLKKSILFNKKQNIPVYKANGDQEKNLWTKDPYLYDKTI